METFGDRFRQLRNEKKLTQEELRTDFNKKYFHNYTATAISLYENNKRMPEIDALKDFASYFYVSVSYLLGETKVRRNDLTADNEAPRHQSPAAPPQKVTLESLALSEGLSDANKEKLAEYLRLLKIDEMQQRNAENANGINVK